MTLLLGMSKAEGIYMSTDYRVTNARSGTLIDDSAIKFLTVHYPPDGAGPKVLFGYTGVAILRDGTPTGQWLRETLRGVSESFDDSMAHLRERLDRDVTPMRVGLIINVLVLQGERRFAGGFTNLEKSDRSSLKLKKSFSYSLQELTEPFVFVNGSGGVQVLADRHLDLVRSQLGVRPRKPMDHMNLLAQVNRRVAALNQTVSPYCHVAFVNADDTTSPTSHAFVEGIESVPFDMPFLLFGLDLSDEFRGLMERSQEFFKTGKPMPESDSVEEINKRIQRRP